MNRRRLLALIFSVVVAATAAYAGTSVTFNGTSYTIPAVGDAAWGTNVSNYLVALSTGTLQKTGGSFTLTNDVNFGATYGLISSYFKSRSANPATGGAVRLSNTDTIEWRNAGNTGEIALSATSGALTVNGVGLVDLTSAQTLTNKTLTQPVIATISNSGVLTLPATTDTLVGRATTDTLTNKTLTSPVISTIVNTGTLTLPSSSDTLVGRATTDTLTNKTLTQPVISTVSNGGVITLPSGTRTLVAQDTTDTLTHKTLTSPTITGSSSTAITSLGLRDTSAAFDVTVAATSSTNLTAGRTLTLDMANAPWTLKAGPLSNFSTLADGGSGQVLTTSGSNSGYSWSSPLVNPMTTDQDMIFASGAGTLTRLPKGAGSQVLRMTDSTGKLGWGAINLSSAAAVTSVLTVANGGTGDSNFASNAVLYGNNTSNVQALAVNASATTGFLSQASSAAPAWTSSTGTGNVMLASSPAVTTPTIYGITSGSAACAGCVGETVTSLGVGSSGFGNGTTIAITSITLTAGFWQISGCAALITSANTTFHTAGDNEYLMISTTSASSAGTTETYDQIINIIATSAAPGSGGRYASCIPAKVVNIGSSNTYYLNAQFNWNTSATGPTATGSIWATRLH